MRHKPRPADRDLCHSHSNLRMMRAPRAALPWPASQYSTYAAAPPGARAGLRRVVRVGRHVLCHILGADDEGRPKSMTELADTFDAAFSKAVDLGNRIAARQGLPNLWDIAAGCSPVRSILVVFASAVRDPRCQDCMPSVRPGPMAELNASSAAGFRERILPHAHRRPRRPRVGARRARALRVRRVTPRARFHPLPPPPPAPARTGAAFLEVRCRMVSGAGSGITLE